MPGAGELERQVAAMRRFNRWYTQKIGVLHDGLLDSPWSLTEVRVMYELAHADGLTAAALARQLDLDTGYLSRLLRNFQRKRLIARTTSTDDRRHQLLTLTDAGRAAFAPLDRRARDEIATLLASVKPDERRRVASALASIETALSATSAAAPTAFFIRTHRPGDIGWIIWRHGVVYAAERGWDERFEALVTEVCFRFLHKHDPRRERCWIAERDGEPVGSVMLVRKSARVAQLRLLLVEPHARGGGLGARLIDECIRFARDAGYAKLVLWTNRGLDAARHLYERVGFVLTEEAPHDSFGEGLIGQQFELTL
jgi:DNA-binding MarR family transcriptional regulator/N-acetylglutamate synthase-like GNAT family acetyltransferase